MPIEKNFKGKYCRNYAKKGIWVSRDGDLAGYLAQGTDSWGYTIPKFHQLRIRHDDCHKFVVHPWYGQVSIPKAVITCYCPPVPNDNKKYTIGYKDGNIQNCNASNLEWVEYHYRKSTANSVTLAYGSYLVKAAMDGSVKVGGKKTTPVENGHFDPDMGLYFPGRTMVFSVGSKYIPGDTIMDNAGYVNGDDAVLADPVILHRDFDWSNFASDNLEWVESSDKRYLEYQHQILIERQAISDKMNAGENLPLDWIK